MSEPAKKQSLGDAVQGFFETAQHGRPLTADERLEWIEIQQKAKIERWRDMTAGGRWPVWPVWASGWLVGFVVHLARGLWWNFRCGYKRTTTHPWMDEYDA